MMKTLRTLSTLMLLASLVMLYLHIYGAALIALTVVGALLAALVALKTKS